MIYSTARAQRKAKAVVPRALARLEQREFCTRAIDTQSALGGGSRSSAVWGRTPDGSVAAQQRQPAGLRVSGRRHVTHSRLALERRRTVKTCKPQLQQQMREPELLCGRRLLRLQSVAACCTSCSQRALCEKRGASISTCPPPRVYICFTTHTLRA